MQTIEAIDTHTAGEPTRIVFNGAPDLGAGSMAERLKTFRERADWLRTALISEPRGSDWLVGALLQTPTDRACAAGVIFFNNTGYLGMCGHGLIGVVEALAYRGRIAVGSHRIETPVGEVTATLHEDGSISIGNVESYRWRENVEVPVEGEGVICGDIAYGGNWFFLSSVPQFQTSDIAALHSRCMRIREALRQHDIRGASGAEIDHIELCGPPSDRDKADGRNFVLCPGGEYDRSPCGTGTSAKLACLAASGQLDAGQIWRQESIIGSLFTGRYAMSPGGVAPTITGRAYVTGEMKFVLVDDDPFRFGIPSVK